MEGPAFMKNAYCPRCGVEVQSLFHLRPPVTNRSLRAIACDNCLANPDTTLKEIGADPSSCTKCFAQVYREWRFCTFCRTAPTRPS